MEKKRRWRKDFSTASRNIYKQAKKPRAKRTDFLTSSASISEFVKKTSNSIQFDVLTVTYNEFKKFCLKSYIEGFAPASPFIFHKTEA